MSEGTPAMWMRGGTSKGLYFLKDDIPNDIAKRKDFLLSVFGSPDNLQINGVGGGNPLTSKVAIVSKSKRSESNRDEISIKYEIIKNDESIINDYTDVFYLDKNIEPGNEYCYSVIIKDSNDHLIRTTDVECITIESSTPDYISGDVTQDGLVNVLDIVLLIDMILNPQPSEECNVIPEVGPCDGICPTYYYNQDTNQCEEFITGCCGVEAFDTMEDCLDICEQF